MHASLVEHLVQTRGIETEYLDSWGKLASVALESQEKILAAMGYQMDNDEALINMLNTEAETDWFTMVEPVSVITEGQDRVLHFKLPLEFANDELHLTITQNSQICKKIKFIPIDQELLGAFEIKDMEMQHYALPINLDLEVGYYQLDLVEPGIEEPLGSGTLIVTPEFCYQSLEVTLKETTKLTFDTSNTLTFGDSKLSSSSAELQKREKQALQNENLYCKNVTLGEAPSDLKPLGHCSDITPINPVLLYKKAYQPIIELLRSYMKANNTLKINNIISLLKSWWIPKGESAKEGAYVHYPFEDLLAIIALESLISECSVVIGDFNTLPEDVSDLLLTMKMHKADH